MMTPDRSQIEAVLDFLAAADGLKTVERRSYLSDGSRHENPAEHSWHACLTALLMHPYLQQTVDLPHTLILLVIHDLVEVYAGDTYAYDTVAQRDQADRERAAAEKLFGLLPDNQRDLLHSLWREFEDQATPEARFARAIDMSHGFAQNLFSGGRAWREHGVTARHAHEYNAPAERMDPALAMLYDVLHGRAKAGDMWHSDTGEGVESR